MKEATGEVSMTVITLVAIAVIGTIIALMWPKIEERISSLWNNNDCPAGQRPTADGGCEPVNID